MPDRFLIDTSVWLDVLPRTQVHAALRARIDSILQDRAAVITGVVRAELLRGTRDEAQYRRTERLMSGLPALSMTEDHWDDVGRLGFELRRQAITIALPDLIVAVVAMREGAIVLHRDNHFDLIARMAPLRVESHL